MIGINSSKPHVALLQSIRGVTLAQLRQASIESSLQVWWDKCRNPDAMIWFLEASGIWDERLSRKFSCSLIRRVEGRLTPAQLGHLETIERYTQGELGIEEIAKLRRVLIQKVIKTGYSKPIEKTLDRALVWASWMDGRGRDWRGTREVVDGLHQIIDTLYSAGSYARDGMGEKIVKRSTITKNRESIAKAVRQVTPILPDISAIKIKPQRSMSQHEIERMLARDEEGVEV